MRVIATAVQTILASLNPTASLGLFYIPGLGLRWTDWVRDVVWDGETWVAGAGSKGFECNGLGENLNAAVPSAELRLHDVGGAQQAQFWADSFRGKTIEITGILKSGIGSDDGIVYPTTTWRMDSDTDGRSGVVVKLDMSDARQAIPHRSTQESHCEHEYGPDAADAGRISLCTYRGTLTTCEQTKDACVLHFKDIDSAGDEWVDGTSTGARYPVPLPYGGSPSGMADRLVT